uniref:Uncharacterized protein n=1 Tax=Anguilla anguilla TaxID=7936 RepID=A0A0E9WLA4_ANGAN
MSNYFAAAHFALLNYKCTYILGDQNTVAITNQCIYGCK